MADMVGKLGINAGDAFKSTAEIVDFAEQVNKQFTISGAGASEAANASLQLTQALASGTLRGDELNSIFEQAPTLIRTVADSMGVSVGQIRELASEGQITADIVKNALLDAADETNAKFEAMPKTFGQIWTDFKNQALFAFQPLFEGLSETANGTAFNRFVQGAMSAFSALGPVVTNALNGILAFVTNDTVTAFFSTLKDSIMKVIDAFAGLSGAENPSGILDLLADSATMLIEAATPLVGVLGNVLSKLIEFAGTDGGKATIMGLATAFGILQVGIAGVKISDFINKVKGLSEVGTFASGLKTLAMSTQIATAAQWLFNTSLFGCPIIWIIAAIAALIAIIVLCVKHWDKIKEVALNCWEAIKSAWGAVANWFKGIWESIKSSAVAIWENIKSVFSSVVNWIKQNFVSIIAFIINPFAGVFSYLYNNCEGFRNIVNNVINAIKNFFVGLWESIKSGAQSAWGAIAGVFTSIWNTISPLVMAIWNLISTLFTTIASIISAIMQGIWATIQTVWTAISMTISNVCTSIWNAIVSIWNAIVAFIAPILQSIWNTITTVWNAIWTTITTVCTAIWNTIVSIWNAIVSVVITAINAVKSVVTSIWNNIKSVTTSVWNNIKNKISETWNNIVSAVTNKVTEVYNKIKSKFDEILNFLGGLKDKMLQKGKDIIQGLIDGIADKINGVADKIKEVGETVTNGIKNFFNIGSPSKVMHKLGEFTFAGFNNGLQTMIDKIKRTTVNMGEVVTNVLPVQPNKSAIGLKTKEDFAAMRQSVSNKTNNYTTIKAPISVEVKNSNNFKSEQDLSKFTRNLANGIAQQIGMQLEGVC